MRLIESRLTMVATYVVLAIGAFIALFPIALLVVNALKPAAAIVVSPLSLPGIIRWENFSHAWRDAHFSQFDIHNGLGKKATPSAMRSVRTRQWHLVRQYNKNHPDELFDLTNDPDELINLYDVPAHHAIREQLQNVE